MYKQTDLVATLNDLPEKNLYRGDVGTIAFVYDGGSYLKYTPLFLSKSSLLL